MTPAEVDRYTRRRPLQPLDDRYDRYDRYSTVTPSTIPGPRYFPYVLRIYGFTDLPPSLPLFPGTPFTRSYESSYRRSTARVSHSVPHTETDSTKKIRASHFHPSDLPLGNPVP